MGLQVTATPLSGGMDNPVTDLIERSRNLRAIAAEARSRFQEAEGWIEPSTAAARDRREHWRRLRGMMRRRVDAARGSPDRANARQPSRPT